MEKIMAYFDGDSKRFHRLRCPRCFGQFIFNGLEIKC